MNMRNEVFKQYRKINIKIFKINRKISIRRSIDLHCYQTVRQMDYENYMIGLLMPTKYKSAFFALRAFNIEISNLKDNLTNANTYRLRFQWWKTTIHDIFLKESKFSSSHPIAIAISDNLSSAPELTNHWFQKYLDTRYTDCISKESFQTIDDLEDYCESCHSSLLYIFMLAQDISNQEEYIIASHIGVSYGISTILRSFLLDPSKACCYIPRELISKHGLTAKVLTSPIEDAETNRLQQNLIHDLASQAYAHLDRALVLSQALPNDRFQKLKYPYMSIVFCSHFLDCLEQSDFQPAVFIRNSSSWYYKFMYQFKLLRMRLSSKQMKV